jgi:hypothetical protein
MNRTRVSLSTNFYLFVLKIVMFHLFSTSQLRLTYRPLNCIPTLFFPSMKQLLFATGQYNIAYKQVYKRQNCNCVPTHCFSFHAIIYYLLQDSNIWRTHRTEKRQILRSSKIEANKTLLVPRKHMHILHLKNHGAWHTEFLCFPCALSFSFFFPFHVS